jgi:phosphonopyruvate decarboxylase
VNRANAVSAVLQGLDEHDYLVSTTGLISREVCAQHDRPRNFYMLGSMGLASSLALGLAILRPAARVVVLEGDGSALMSLGALALTAAERASNLTHVILDNQAYESTGGQRSISAYVDLARIGEAAGYYRVHDARTPETLVSALQPAPGPILVVARVELDAGLSPPPRVGKAPPQIRDRFRTELAVDSVLGNEA